MHMSKPLFSGLLLAAVVVASNIDDVPHQCHDVCAPVVSLASSCEDRNDDDDDDEVDCICNASDASTNIPICDACITTYGNDGRDNDVNDLVQSCSFTTTSYISMSSTASAATVTTGPVTSAATTTSATTTSATTTSATTASATTTSSSSSTGPTTSSSTSTSASAPTTSLGVAGANANINSGMLGLIGAGALAIMNL